MKSERRKTQIISFIPDGDYYFDKGLLAYQKGDLRRAKKYCDRAIAFNPEQTDYLCQQAAILAELEEFETSNKVLQQAVTIDSSIAECYFFMANNYAHLGHFEQSIEKVKKYMAEDPNGPFVQDARELYKLLMIESDSLDLEEPQYIIDHEKGRKALDQGNYKEAIRLFNKVIKQQHTFWAAYNNLALAHYSEGHYDEAFNNLKKVLTENPGNIHALCNLTVLYKQLDMTDELKHEVEQLKGLYPLYPEHRSKLGSTFYLVGEYELAYKWLTSADKAASHWESNFYYWLSLAAFQTNHTKQAMKAWNKVLFFREGNHHPFDYGKIRDMIRSDDAHRNPMVRALLKEQLKGQAIAPKIYSLFLLRHFADSDAVASIEYVKNQTHETKEIRWVAGMLLKMINDGVQSVDMDHQEDIDHRMKVMLLIESELGGNKPPIHAYAIYEWWLRFVKETMTDIDLDYKAWAGAFLYLYKSKMDGTTQTDISEKLGISLYRLRKYIKTLRQLLS